MQEENFVMKLILKSYQIGHLNENPWKMFGILPFHVNM